MSIMDDSGPSIEGRMVISSELFPKDVLERLVKGSHLGIPPLIIAFPQAFVAGGMTMEMNMDKSTISFDFLAYEIHIKEA